MKHLTRVAAVTATTALAAAGLVGTATTSADAAKATTLNTSYHCSVAGQEFDLPVSLTSNLPTKAKAGKKVGATNVGISVTVPGSLVGLAASLFSATEMGGTIAGDMMAGKTKIPLSGTTDLSPIADPTADLAITGTGKAAAFTLKKAGTYVVKAPAALSFVPLKDGGAELSPGLAVPCTLGTGSPSKLGSIKVTK